MVQNYSNILAAVDIGSSKICTVIAEILEEEINVIGVSSVPHSGVIKGAIVDIAETAYAIQKSISKAEELANVKVESVLTSISGKSISGVIGHGIASLSNSKQKTITEAEIKMVLDAAKAIPMSPDEEELHTEPIQFIVDFQDEIKNPLGMTGMKLGLDAYIIKVSTTAVENIKRVIEKAGYQVLNIIASPLASSKATLYQDEMDIGVLMLDIGAGTTEITVYQKNALRFIKIIPIGGHFITGDIAIGLHISKAEAEELKKKKAILFDTDPGANELIKIPDISGEIIEIQRKELIQYIRPRVEELFVYVETELGKGGINKSMYSGGIVITGGSALLNGIDKFAKLHFKTRCRIGVPIKGKIVGLYDIVSSPEYSTAIGLIDYFISGNNFFEELRRNKSFSEKIIFWLKKFFSEFF